MDYYIQGDAANADKINAAFEFVNERITYERFNRAKIRKTCCYK